MCIRDRINIDEISPDWPGKGDYYNTYLAVTPVLSGPLGGDQMIGAMIAQPIYFPMPLNIRPKKEK